VINARYADDQPERVVDTCVPNVARIYDFLLGGKDNFAVDRAAARALLAAVPEAARAARGNRAFLTGAVRFLAQEAGIRQFLDIGTGLPARGHVHEIAREADPMARVVYCDNDPVVMAHANALLADASTVAAAECDVRFPDQLITHPRVRALIDFDRPVAVLLVAVLHFLEDSDGPWGAVRSIKDRLAPGSYLVVSHVTGDEITLEALRQARAVCQGASAPGTARSREDIERFFDGLDMVEPGVVDVAVWHARRSARQIRPALFYAGVGRKPGIPGQP
jgi:SAM-dependent methyltransferase